MIFCQGVILDLTNHFLHWAGGKAKLVPLLSSLIDFNRYTKIMEPFAGTGALSFACADKVDQIILNDANDDLMTMYRSIKGDVEDFIKLAREYFSEDYNTPEAYYRIRNCFNANKRDYLNVRIGAVFLYLNRFGYNGLCRYNKKGEFNVPFRHNHKLPNFPEAEIRDIAEKLKKTNLMCSDFYNLVDLTTSDFVVYLDPPYVPLSETSNFTGYCGTFDMHDQELVAQFARNAQKNGALVLISNHDLPVTRELYHDASEIITTDARRMISCKGDKREVVKELIAIYR